MRAHERHLVRSLKPARMSYRKGNGTAEVLLENVSTHGAGMTMYEEPRIGATIILAFDLSGETHELRAQIRWGKESGPKQWAAGCRFEKPLRASTLNCDSLEPTAERRAASCKAVMRRESAPDHPYEVEIRNYSGRGIGVVTDERFGPGESVMLELHGQTFVVRMQWSETRGGDVFVGCKFKKSADVARMYELMGLGSANAIIDRPVMGASVAVLLGTLLAAAVVFLGGDGLPF